MGGLEHGESVFCGCDFCLKVLLCLWVLMVCCVVAAAGGVLLDVSIYIK